MQDLQILNQIYTLFNTICYIPYMLYWLSGFAFNMYWLSCMFIIIYKSNIYNNVRNQKYFDCLSIVGLELYYLYGVLSWNPLIISILMFHSIIIDNNPYKLIYDLFREFDEFDVIMKVNTTTNQEEETVTEQEETVTEQEEAVTEQEETVTEQEEETVTEQEEETVTEQEEETVTEQEETVTEQEEETVTEQEDAVDTTPIVIAVTEEKHAMEQ